MDSKVAVPTFIWLADTNEDGVAKFLEPIIAAYALIDFKYGRDKNMYFSGIPVPRDKLVYMMRQVARIFSVPEPKEEDRIERPIELLGYIIKNRPKA